jgi:hypothetical protein
LNNFGGNSPNHHWPGRKLKLGATRHSFCNESYSAFSIHDGQLPVFFNDENALQPRRHILKRKLQVKEKRAGPAGEAFFPAGP